MKNHHMAVATELTVELDQIGAGFDRFREREPGIFRIRSGSAAMGDILPTGHF